VIRPSLDGEQPCEYGFREETSMYGIVMEFGDDVTKAQYDAVNEKLGIDNEAGTGDWPKGIKSHAGGTTPTGFCVYEVWDSKAEYEAWMGGRLGAALGAVGVSAPVRVTEIDLVGFATP
jgi:hypothetical protein